MKVGIYVRISSDPHGLRAGVQRQEEDCRQECGRRGWDVAGIYADNDISAYSGKPRPAYQQLCADLADGRISGVVVWAMDRLHRSPTELETFVDLINQCGAQVVACMAGEVDLSTADGRFHARMLGTVARHESEKKSERIRRAKLQRAQTGRWSGGGKRPFGFAADGETQRPEEVAVIREVLARFNRGEALGGIAADLQARHIPTSYGGRWNKTTLRQILTSERIVGRRVHRGRSYPAVWGPVVDPEDWAYAQVLLAGRPATRTPGRTYLLTGLLDCGKCGKPLTSRAGGGYRRYVCDTPARGGCGGISIVADPLELYVRKKVKERGYGRKAPAGLIAQRERHLRALESRLDALDAAHYVDGKFSQEKYTEMRLALEQKVQDARARLEIPVQPPVGAEVGTGGEGLEEKRARIQSACTRILILPATKRGPGLDTSRIKIVWRALYRT